MKTTTIEQTAFYLTDSLLVACARHCAKVSHRRYWGEAADLDLILVVWGAMPRSTDSERERELQRAIKALIKLGLLVRRGKRIDVPAIELSPAMADRMAALLSIELRTACRYEITSAEVMRSASVALLGLTPERAEIVIRDLYTRGFSQSYLMGVERLLLQAA